MSAAKLLAQPLSLFVFLSTGIWCVLMYAPKLTRKISRLLLLSLGGLLLALWLVSTPAMARWLELSLQDVSSARGMNDPDVIVVLAGGFVEGDVPEHDVLSSETARRVITAASRWKLTRRATLVMSGAGGWVRKERETELMADLALQHGVPRGAIICESVSGSTWEHPLRIADLSNMTRKSKILVVTSGWHARRALREFQKKFDQVSVSPVANHRSERFHLFQLLPSVEALNVSTDMVKEYVGYCWYAFKSIP